MCTKISLQRTYPSGEKIFFVMIRVRWVMYWSIEKSLRMSKNKIPRLLWGFWQMIWTALVERSIEIFCMKSKVIFSQAVCLSGSRLFHIFYKQHFWFFFDFFSSKNRIGFVILKCFCYAEARSICWYLRNTGQILPNVRMTKTTDKKSYIL